jgi:uncharacterized phage protein (TIGR01671 family)
MREILFRGKTERGGWVYGSLIHVGNFCCILEEDNGRYDYPYLDKDLGVIDGQAIPVVLETVGQFTGLVDKNGKKIFEGDILEFSDRLVAVFWHAHLGCWDCHFLKYTNPKNGRDDMSPCSWDCKSKIVGNIHDNPELIKGDS